MESINPDLKFEMELEEDFPDQKLPTLDTLVSLERSPDSDQPPQFTFSFYEEIMNSRYVLLEKSAMPYKQKCAILSQEVVRRMLNTKIASVNKKETSSWINSLKNYFVLDTAFNKTEKY